MGEVYKATDTRLERTVAIKVLPAHVASDPDLRQRFEREAKTISSLNHPHICTLYEFDTQEGTDFLVMEYLEGETLAQRLTKGALPLDQALRYAIQIADALDKAHRQGVTHRDLKPANIMLTKAGAKLLDFGLAKLTPTGPQGDASTKLGESLTQPGTILGTYQYMAPEQFERGQANALTDIWAFGCVVYEMVTGQKAFTGESQASLIHAIMGVDPPAMSSLQVMSPPALDQIVKTCLAKDPDTRWQSAGDVGRQLQWITASGSQVGVPAVVATGSKTRERLWMTVAAGGVVAAVLATALAALYVNRAPVEDVRARFSVPTGLLPDGERFGYGSGVVSGLALSPDGTQLAFVTGGFPYGQLWVRPLDSVDARALPGADDASFPFWSPDGRSIGFFTPSELKTVDLTGGPPQTVCAVSIGMGGTWNEDDVIVFGSLTGNLHQVEVAGDEPIPLGGLDVLGAAIHYWPQFLPDGEHVLFLALARGDQERGIYVGSLRSGTTPSHIVQTTLMARYAAPGYLLFGRGGALMAQPFDLERLGVMGDTARVADKVVSDPDLGWLGFSTSGPGRDWRMSARPDPR